MWLNLDEDYLDESEIQGLGLEKFGSPDLFQSLGPTFYIMLGISLFFTLLALVIIFVGRRIPNLSEKN